MGDLLLRLEEACLGLGTLQLVLPGLAAAAVGLFLWLAGARYAWIVVGLLGAIAGGGDRVGDGSAIAFGYAGGGGGGCGGDGAAGIVDEANRDDCVGGGDFCGDLRIGLYQFFRSIRRRGGRWIRRGGFGRAGRAE